MEPTPTELLAIDHVGPDAVALELAAPAGFSASPGQFVKLVLTIDGEELVRFYTISSPDTDESLELTLGIDPEGTVGPSIERLDVGATVRIAGPFGNAYYEGEPETLVLAGGPGIGAAIGIAERTLDDGGRTAVVYRDEGVLHRERLDGLTERGASVELLGPEGDLRAAIERALAAVEPDESPQVFVYGFASFLDAATDALVAAGGTPENAKLESFG